MNINEVQNSVFKYTEIDFLLGKGTVLSALLKRCSSVWTWDHMLFKHLEMYLFKMYVESPVDILFNYSIISITCTAFTHSHRSQAGLQKGLHLCETREGSEALLLGPVSQTQLTSCCRREILHIQLPTGILTSLWSAKG